MRGHIRAIYLSLYLSCFCIFIYVLWRYPAYGYDLRGTTQQPLTSMAGACFNRLPRASLTRATMSLLWYLCIDYLASCTRIPWREGASQSWNWKHDDLCFWFPSWASGSEDRRSDPSGFSKFSPEAHTLTYVICGSFCKLGLLLVGVLISALPFGVCIRLPDSWKLSDTFAPRPPRNLQPWPESQHEGHLVKYLRYVFRLDTCKTVDKPYGLNDSMNHTVWSITVYHQNSDKTNADINPCQGHPLLKAPSIQGNRPDP